MGGCSLCSRQRAKLTVCGEGFLPYIIVLAFLCSKGVTRKRAEIRAIGENADRHEQNFSEKEFALIKELVQARMEQKQNLEYESFDGYELPPRTQFSMLKKPAVSIIYGKLTFNMASIRLLEGVKYILTIVNTKKKSLDPILSIWGRRNTINIGIDVIRLLGEPTHIWIMKNIHNF